MCREVLVSEPYKFKLRTPERGQAWESLAQQLNSIHQPKFRVTARSVRDRFSLLSTKYAQKLRMEERASGIEVEQTELERLIDEILEREKDAKRELDSKDREKKSKADKEKATAEQVRKQAMERMAKRSDDQENKQKKPKIRRSTGDAIEYLRERSENDREHKKEELEVRKREIEVQAEKQDQAQKQQQAMFSALMAQIQQQQQQQQNVQVMLVAQQQQQTKLLMAFMESNKKQ